LRPITTFECQSPLEKVRTRHSRYLLTLASHVKELAQSRPSLSEGEKKEIEKRMTTRYPNAGLTFLIQMSVDPIARELNGER